MRVVIIGAGLLGVATAYHLQQAGLEVTLVDRRPGPGEETSARNGSVLHPSLAEPWNSPGIWRTLVRSIGREDAALLLRLRALPGSLRWGIRFLHAASPARFAEGTRRNVRLAMANEQQLAEIRDRTGIDFHWYRRGILTVFREEPALESALRASRMLVELGVQVQALDVATTVATEPALADVHGALAGALFAPGCEGGDPMLFCQALAMWLAERGVRQRYGTSVSRIERSGGKVSKVVLESGEAWPVDHVVLAAGSYSVALARQVGLRLPIRPVKGYSLTLPRSDGDGAPRMPVGDALLHVVVTPVGDDRIRVAGTAELAGYDTTASEARAANLVGLLERVFPRFAAATRGVDRQVWTGLRPTSADGVPLIGATGTANLWLNTGHGHVGWTMAAASGRLISDIMLGRAPILPARDYAPDRF
jgi:D-amino-acid dehydrogenase